MSAVSDSIALVYGAIAILIHLAAFELFASTPILFGIVALRCREGGPTRCGTKARAVSYLTSHIQITNCYLFPAVSSQQGAEALPLSTRNCPISTLDLADDLQTANPSAR